MREVVEQVSVSLNVINPSTGEVFDVVGNNTKQTRYYSIRNLNFKGNIMDLFTYQAKLCKSSKDIELFRDILLSVDKHNEFRKTISSFAEQTGNSRQRVTKLLKDAVDIGFMKRIDRGVYLVNPFTFKAKGTNNTTIESLQKEW